MNDHKKPYPGAHPIFRCRWCGRLIYVPHSDHFRVYGGCEKYWAVRERVYREEMAR